MGFVGRSRRFLHALTLFDKLAPLEGYRLFSSARTTTGFSHRRWNSKREFCPLFGNFLLSLSDFLFAVKASVNVGKCPECCQRCQGRDSDVLPGSETDQTKVIDAQEVVFFVHLSTFRVDVSSEEQQEIFVKTGKPLFRCFLNFLNEKKKKFCPWTQRRSCLLPEIGFDKTFSWSSFEKKKKKS